MRRLRHVLITGIVLLLGLAVVVPVAAQSTVTNVWQINIDVPVVNRSVLGTLTTTTDAATGAGTWSFQGTVDGKFARASGQGTISGSGSTANVTMTSVDSWDVPGISKPVHLPATATIRTVGSIAYISFSGNTISFAGAMVAVDSPLTFPLQSGTHTVTMPGSGSQTVQVLPNTGQVSAEVEARTAPARDVDMFLALSSVAAMVLGAAVALTVHRRRTAGRLEANL